MTEVILDTIALVTLPSAKSTLELQDLSISKLIRLAVSSDITLVVAPLSRTQITV